MKIIYLHQYFGGPNSTGGTRTYEMAKRLVARGHAVHVVTSARNGTTYLGPWRSEEMAGIQVHSVPVPYSNSMSYPRRILSFFAFAARSGIYARRLRGDLVFATSTPLTIALPAAFAIFLRKSPMVFEVRDLWPEMPVATGALRNPLLIFLARALERFAYRHAAQVVALSPGMVKGVALTGYPIASITMIPNASDLELFGGQDANARIWRDSLDWLGNRPLVLYCGTFGTINDLRYLVEVAAEAQTMNSDLRFLVVGSGGEERQIRERAVELGVLNESFFMLERIPKNEIPVVFAAATICTSLFAPVKEMESNSANKFFDSLAAGRPVAINYGGWHEELLDSHHAGMRIDPLDHALAARVLVDLVADASRLKSLGLAARRLAESEFARDLLAEQLNGVFERTVSDPPSRHRVADRLDRVATTLGGSILCAKARSHRTKIDTPNDSQ